MPDQRTLAVYDARAAEYAACFDDTDKPSRHLNAFMAALPEGGYVLDLGCGPGRASVRLRDAGYRVDPIDASAEMVRLARETHDLPARQATFDNITGTDKYDGVWANFSLLHAPRADLPKHLSALATALRPRGVLHIGMKIGTGTSRDAIDRLYTFVTEEELKTLLGDAGFKLLSTDLGQEAGLAGTVDPWIICQAQKP